MKLFFYTLLTAFVHGSRYGPSQDEPCQTTDERVGALEAKTKVLQEVIFKLQDQIFSLTTRPAGETSSNGNSFQALETPFVHEISIGGTNGVFRQTIESNDIGDTAAFVLAEVFSSYNLKDHFVITLARTCTAAPGWTGSGGKFHEEFKSDMQKVYLL